MSGTLHPATTERRAGPTTRLQERSGNNNTSASRSPRLRSQVTSNMTAPARQETAMTTPACSEDWLPYAAKPTLQPKAHYSKVVKALKHRDWFIAFIWAIETSNKDNGIQSKLLFKLYFFLRDFIPQGLSGKFGHIKGDQVMEQLLCHAETTPSRHKVTKYAEITFSDLERWMGKHESWQSALNEAKAGYERQKKAGVKKRPPWRAPGLHSPAGMLAVLVIAHPDLDGAKFRNWIGRLQIEWMMTQDPDVLKVEKGFWKGLDKDNVYSVFTPAESREADGPLFADYDRLLGEDFTRCRKDIRPFLPQWAHGITPVEEAADDDSGGDGDEHGDDGDGGGYGDCDYDDSKDGDGGDSDGSHDGSVSAHDVLALEKHLYPTTKVDLGELRSWLFAKMKSVGANKNEDSVLLAWAKHWADRGERVQNHLQQRIVRELFVQSLRRLHSMDSSGTSLATAYMLADVADSELHPVEQSSLKEARRVLQTLPEYQAFREAEAELVRAAPKSPGGVVRNVLKRIKEAQACFFFSLIEGQDFFQHWKSVMEFETARTYVLLQSLKKTPVQERRAQFPSQDDMALMMLTVWQIRMLILPQGLSVLTATQDEAQKRIEAGLPIQDELQASPMAIAPSGLSMQKHQSLFSLLGDFVQQTSPGYATSGQSSRRQSSVGIELSEPIPDTPSEGPTQLPTSVPDKWSSTRNSHQAAPVSSARNTPRPTEPQPWTTLTPNQTISPSNTRNPWAGESCIPKKRRMSSDFSERRTGTPRLDFKQALQAGWDKLREDLKEDLKALEHNRALEVKSAVDSLRGDLSSLGVDLASIKELVMSSAGELKTGIQAELASSVDQVNAGLQSNIKTELASSVDQVKAGLRSNIKIELTSSMERVKAELGSNIKTEITSSMDQVRAELESNTNRLEDLAAKVASITSGLDAEYRNSTQQLRESTHAISSNMQSVVKQIETSMQAIVKRSEAKPPPTLGADGFLREHCPAPPGRSQQDYDTQLERAAWSYICHLGNPDDGVGPNGEALERTHGIFPDLDMDHIKTAIEHVHMRVWRRPLNGQNDDAGQDDLDHDILDFIMAA